MIRAPQYQHARERHCRPAVHDPVSLTSQKYQEHIHRTHTRSEWYKVPNTRTEYEEGKPERERRNINKSETKARMPSERRPSPVGTRLLLVCTISYMPKWWTNSTLTKKYETKRRKERQVAKTKRAILCPGGGPRLLLLVDEARLHVKDAPVRFAGLLHLFACSMHAISTACLDRSGASTPSISHVSCQLLRFVFSWTRIPASHSAGASYSDIYLWCVGKRRGGRREQSSHAPTAAVKIAVQA